MTHHAHREVRPSVRAHGCYPTGVVACRAWSSADIEHPSGILSGSHAAAHVIMQSAVHGKQSTIAAEPSHEPSLSPSALRRSTTCRHAMSVVLCAAF